MFLGANRVSSRRSAMGYFRKSRCTHYSHTRKRSNRKKPEYFLQNYTFFFSKNRVEAAKENDGNTVAVATNQTRAASVVKASPFFFPLQFTNRFRCQGTHFTRAKRAVVALGALCPPPPVPSAKNGIVFWQENNTSIYSGSLLCSFPPVLPYLALPLTVCSIYLPIPFYFQHPDK